VLLSLQAQPLVGVQRGQLGELRALLGLLDVQTVDAVDPDQRVELLSLLLAVARLAHCAGDRVTSAQRVLTDQR
jgi:hypothetical protein